MFLVIEVGVEETNGVDGVGHGGGHCPVVFASSECGSEESSCFSGCSG